MPVGYPSTERQANHSDEDSGLEICLPGVMQTQAGHTVAHLDNDAKLTMYEKQDIESGGNQLHESHHSDLKSDAHSYLEAEIQKNGSSGPESSISRRRSNLNFLENTSSMIIPDTPSREMNRLRQPSGRKSGDDHKNYKVRGEDKTRNNPEKSRHTTGKTIHSKDNITVSQIGVIGSDLIPNASVKISSLGSEVYEREHRNGDYESSAGRKKLKTQHSANEPVQNSPAFLESACQAQVAKRDFLHMLAATKMNSSHADTALTSSFVTDQPIERLSQSLPEHVSVLPTNLNNVISKEDGFQRNLDGSVQSHNLAEKSKSVNIQSMSQEKPVDQHESAVGRNFPAETTSNIPSQGHEKPCGSARTNPSSPLVNNVVYITFKEVYPDYTGDLKHFLGICRSIEISQRAGTAQHRSLWDDFVVKHITDYGPYLITCNAAEEKPISYEQYYRDRVDEPCHNKRVLTPESLTEALDLKTRVSSANSIGINNFQPFNHSSNRVSNGSNSSLRRRKGKKSGYLSSSPTSIQWKKESNYASQTEVAPNVVNSMQTLPRHGKNGNLQNSPQHAIRNSANGSFERRETYQAYNNSNGSSRNSSQSRKHASANNRTSLASSPLGSNLVVQRGKVGHIDQTPNSEKLRKTDQNRRSKPLPALLHRTKKDTELHLLSSLPFPLSSSPPSKYLYSSGSSIHTQTQSDNDGDAKDIEIPPLQHNTEYDRAAMSKVFHQSSSSIPSSSPPPTLPAVISISAEKPTVPVNQTNKSGNKANVSSLPISSTTNQILQQTLLAEQLRNQKDDRLEITKETEPETEQGSIPKMWWREEHTMFKEFASGYARLKNVNWSLGMPVIEEDKLSSSRASKTKESCKREYSNRKDANISHVDLAQDEILRERDRKSKDWSVDVLSWKL